MQVHDGELPRARQLARTGKELSREARTRLAGWISIVGAATGPQYCQFQRKTPSGISSGFKTVTIVWMTVEAAVSLSAAWVALSPALH